MSEKELLYIDDTLSHLEQFNDFCNEYIIDVDNMELKNAIEEIIKINMDIYKDFYKLNCK